MARVKSRIPIVFMLRLHRALARKLSSTSFDCGSLCGPNQRKQKKTRDENKNNRHDNWIHFNFRAVLPIPCHSHSGQSFERGSARKVYLHTSWLQTMFIVSSPIFPYPWPSSSRPVHKANHKQKYPPRAVCSVPINVWWERAQQHTTGSVQKHVPPSRT